MTQKKLSPEQIKDALLGGKVISKKGWSINISESDEVEVWTPNGDGFKTTLAYLDRAVSDFCKQAEMPIPGSFPADHPPKDVSDGDLGEDTSTKEISEMDPTINETDVPDGKKSDPDLGADTSTDEPFTVPAVNETPPDNVDIPGSDPDLGSDTSKQDPEWVGKAGQSSGKFDSPEAERFWEMTLDGVHDWEAGDTDTMGWYGGFDDEMAIVMADSQGFVYLEQFDDPNEYAEAKGEIEDEYAATHDEEETMEDYEKRMEWDREGSKIKDSFEGRDDTPAIYRELRAKRPSEDLLEDIIDPAKWAATQFLKAAESDPFDVEVNERDPEPDEVSDFDKEDVALEDEGERKESLDEKAVGVSPAKRKRVAQSLEEIIRQLQEAGTYDPNITVQELLDMYSQQGAVASKVYTKVAVAPPGEKWERLVKELKDDPKVEEPYAVAWAQYNKSKGKESRKQAGPKLREKWDGQGAYNRDIEAESPQMLHDLVRSFGGEEVDWSVYQQPIGDEATSDGEDPELGVMKANVDKEAVDPEAEKYWSDYYGDYGRELSKGDTSKRDKRDKGKDKDKKDDEKDDKKEAQAAPIPVEEEPAAPVEPTAPTPGAVPAPAKPAPKAPGGGAGAPGAGDSGLKALGWTQQEIQLMDEEDKQKILQNKIHKPGTKPKAQPGTEPGAKAPAPGAPPAGGQPAPAGPEAPAEPAVQAPVPKQPIAKMARLIQRKLLLRQAQQMLQQPAEIEPAPVPAAPATETPATPKSDVLPEYGEDTLASAEQQAFQILSEVKQQEVTGRDAQDIMMRKVQTLGQRLQTEAGMTIEEAKKLYGVNNLSKLFQ